MAGQGPNKDLSATDRTSSTFSYPFSSNPFNSRLPVSMIQGSVLNGQNFKLDKTGHLSRPSVPLRERHLPASFWKEPNIPKYPFSHLLPLQWDQQGVEYREFIDRLQHAQNVIHGHRFPITEFLYYNYGMKNRTVPQEPSSSESLWPLGQLKHHPKHAGPTPHPTLCPYSGCTCSNPSMDTSLKGSQSWPSPPNMDVLHSQVWKPIATKTLSSYPNRFHPFAHAR